DRMANAIEMALSGLGNTTANTINKNEILARIGEQNNEFNFKLRDTAAKHYWNYHISYALAEGAATGAGGFAILLADIPLLFGIAMRLIQEIAVCYGFDINTDEEHLYMLNILRVSSTGDVKAKAEFMVILKQVEQILLTITWREMADALAKKQLNSLATIALFRKFCNSLGIQLTKRKALQLVPVFGAFVGAAFNSTFINDVGKAAYMSYRRRKIEELEKK
ncbi:MAG TPA: EcsC family protein, partial [Candidatus Wallbacteria bacterium]|nr:EcsC family protein [Candidatus Wallbacteria bacterium]